MKISEFEAFRSYLTAKGYIADMVTEAENGVEAIILKDTPPNLKDFTQAKRLITGNYWVRLSKLDYNNQAITDRLFSLEY